MRGKRNGIIFFLMLISFSISAQRKGQRIKRYSAGLTYAHIVSDSSASAFKIGYYGGFTSSRPILLRSIQRKNGNPLFYVNAGLDFCSIGSKKIARLYEDSLLIKDSKSSLLYLSLPLSIELNLYNSKSKGQVRQANTSFLSMFGGAKFSYLVRSMIDDRNFKSQTAPYDIQWFAGMRLLGTVNGISVDITYNKGLQSVFRSDKSSRSEYFMFTLSWNRLESGCSTSNRKRKGLFF